MNTLTGDDNYSRFNRENFREKIQVQLSEKQQLFSIFHCISAISSKF